MHRRLASALLVSALSVAFSAAAVVNNSDGTAPATGIADGYALVIFSQPPLAEWPNAARLRNGKLDFTAGANGQYQASLAHVRNDFKQWLKSSGSSARVIREYDTVLDGVAVQLNGASLDSLRGGPSVTLVEPSLTFRPSMDQSPGLINAPAAWAALGGPGDAGAGIKVGVIDTGIDQDHPFINDPSLSPPAGFPKGDQRFTNHKVIVARVYYTGKPGLYTAEGIQAHGTHVSGTIAGRNGFTAPAQAGVAPVTPGMSGIAPKAFLGNYNVFPGPIENAASHDIAQAIEDAVKDGMDVINMSLGGGINGFQDQLTVATNRAVEAGVVVAVAAGNEGPNPNTVGSPGQAALAITAAASSNNRFFGPPVVVSGQTFASVPGNFNPYVPAVTGTLANWSDGGSTACAAASGTPYAGSPVIVVIDRGTCSFSTKIRNAQAAGALGVLMVNNVAGDAIAMGQDGTANQPTIPAVMVSQADGATIKGYSGLSATVDGTNPLPFPTTPDVLASFSSRGPTNLLDIKPDVTGPGVNIYSSIPGGGFAAFNGTSMATPHVAGSAALVRQLHPDWTPAQVKSALVNSATRDPRLGSTNPMLIGAGLLDLAAASTVGATLEPQVLSFRKIEPVSAQTKTIAVSVTNVTGTAQTYSAAAAITAHPAGATGYTASVSPATLTLAAGATGSFAVSVGTSPATALGQYWGRLTVSGGGSTLAAPLWFAVRTNTDAGPLVQ